MVEKLEIDFKENEDS